MMARSTPSLGQWTSTGIVMSKQTRNITHTDELEARIFAGIEKTYLVAKAAYGPGAGNAILEASYGDPLISRDGVTNLEKVFLDDPIENMAARVIVQASKKNNKKVGDGTTAVVILAYHLYKEARKLIAGGYNRMMVAQMLEEDARNAVAALDIMKQPVDAKLLRHVAIVSAGDEAIGQMIADVVEAVGIDGGITVEDFAGNGIYNELVDGFYFRKGFTNINLINDPSNLESRHQNIDILITDKPLKVTTDIAPILDKFVKNGGKELVIVGDVGEEALGVLLLNRLKGIVNVTVADVPVFGAMRSLFLEDIALITGGKVLLPGADPASFEISMLGGAERVTINEFSTTIIGAEGVREDVELRIRELRDQLKEAESPITIEALKDRLAKLTGKIAIIRVGGATEVEQGEVKLRVQDAISAVQAAIQDGIVPGGGVALARMTHMNFYKAYEQPFKQLVDNAGDNPEPYLWKMLEKPVWYGYDLQSNTGKPVDLLKAGVIDPASVIKEVVVNATSVVSKLITASVGITYANRESKND